MDIEFDPEKDRINRAKHGLSLIVARAAFDDYRIDEEDDRDEYGELRYVTLGRSARLVIAFVWTPRWRFDGPRARIISARRGTRREREIYYFERNRVIGSGFLEGRWR